MVGLSNPTPYPLAPVKSFNSSANLDPSAAAVAQSSSAHFLAILVAIVNKLIWEPSTVVTNCGAMLN